ncbi:MAG: RICIN domain-containing protein [Saprospiraceae bacterium]|nr:RICIN domain-containing protein [Saprospiraceae bacterium]
MKNNHFSLFLKTKTFVCLIFSTYTLLAQDPLTDGTHYTIQNKESNKVIDVSGNSQVAGAAIWQYDMNLTNAQKFTFVDAGNGYYYILTNSNLYVTLKYNEPPKTTDKSTISKVGNSYTLMQAPQYTSTSAICKTSVAPSALCPNKQKWKLVSIENNNKTFLIQSIAVPNQVLQPVNSNSSVSIVLSNQNGSQSQKWLINKSECLIIQKEIDSNDAFIKSLQLNKPPGYATQVATLQKKNKELLQRLKDLKC